MLIQALAEYADTYLADQLAEQAFERKPVRYALELYDDGKLAGIRELVEERGGKEVSRTLVVPKSPMSRSGAPYPLLGCDAVQYVLGIGRWTPSGKEHNHQERHAAFVERIRRAADETNDPALEACCLFYDDPKQVSVAREKLGELLQVQGLVTLSVVSRDPTTQHQGGPVFDREGVRVHWRTCYEKDFADQLVRGGEAVCLVTGKLGPFAPTHEKIKGVARLGGQPSGVALMSFDKQAFTSYGWDKNANSPVSPDRATAYVAALNDLLRPGTHRRGASRDRIVRTRHDVGGVGFLYWTKKPTDDDWIALLNEADPEDVHRLFAAPLTGDAEAAVGTNEFYLMAVSGNGGRLLVRYWFRETIGTVERHVRNWFDSLRITNVIDCGVLAPPPKMWELLVSLSPTRTSGRVSERLARVPPAPAVQLMRRALHGLPVGRTVLAAALGRLRAERGSQRLNPARTGLVRMCVNDLTRDQGVETMTESLNPGQDHPAYVCGRLLAVYDRLQYAAQGDVNITVADRYWRLASTFPELAFPKLEDLSRAHLKKLRRDSPGAAVNLEKQIRDLVTRLSGFPGQLSLENQGRFAIGYHHQKAEDARRAAEAKQRKESSAGVA